MRSPSLSTYLDAIATLAQHRLDGLVSRLARRFPAVPEAEVRECVQDVLVEAVDPDRQRWFVEGHALGGAEELDRRVFTAGWRRVRGAVRKVSRQRTDRADTGFDAADPSADGAADVDAGQLAGWLRSRVNEAAGQFGNARHDTLHRALTSLVASGHAVKPLAERYALPRRYVAEAASWLKKRLRDRAQED